MEHMPALAADQVPGAQGKHDVAPAAEYKPPSQSTHALLLAFARVPAPQMVQLAAPAAEICPLSQGSQTVPFTLLYSPAAHRVAQTSAPVALLTKPPGQLLHIASPTAPCAAEYFPRLHPTQCAVLFCGFEVSPKVPAAHRVHCALATPGE